MALSPYASYNPGLLGKKAADRAINFHILFYSLNPWRAADGR